MTIEFLAPQGRVTIGPYRTGDERGILDLFKLVFAVDRSIDVWNWQFRDCPEGIHSYVGRRDDGSIVSQFCGIPVKVKVRELVLCFAQMVDSMVHPDYRGGLKKKGLFATTVDAFVEHFGRVDREVIMMGLPNAEAFRIGRKLCGYVPMTKIYMHTKAIEPDLELPMPAEEVGYRMNRFRVAIVPRFAADLDALWAHASQPHEIVCWRDARAMNWRYPSSPQWSYVLLEARLAATNQLVGVAVLRTMWLGQPDLVIADWLVDRDVDGVPEALLSTSEHLGRKAGMHAVKCLLNHMCEESRFFEDQGYALTPTQFRMVSRTYAPGVVTPPDLNRHWYYTLGDFDIV
jgi:hypothetical protein